MNVARYFIILYFIISLLLCRTYISTDIMYCNIKNLDLQDQICGKYERLEFVDVDWCTFKGILWDFHIYIWKHSVFNFCSNYALYCSSSNLKDSYAYTLSHLRTAVTSLSASRYKRCKFNYVCFNLGIPFWTREKTQQLHER